MVEQMKGSQFPCSGIFGGGIQTMRPGSGRIMAAPDDTIWGLWCSWARKTKRSENDEGLTAIWMK
jgi:hypothetical protein